MIIKVKLYVHIIHQHKFFTIVCALEKIIQREVSSSNVLNAYLFNLSIFPFGNVNLRP